MVAAERTEAEGDNWDVASLAEGGVVPRLGKRCCKHGSTLCWSSERYASQSIPKGMALYKGSRRCIVPVYSLQYAPWGVD
jgi:hypothetical protein